MFIRPLAFVRQSGFAQPLYAKLPGLWAAPVIVATLCASIFQSVYELMYWKEFSRAVLVMPASDLFLKMHSERWMFYWSGFLIAVATVYVLALLRWLYHLGATAILGKWWPEVTSPPLKYFVVTTASWGLWIGIFGSGIMSGVWKSRGGADIDRLLNEFLLEYQGVALVVLLMLAGAFHLAGKNSHIGLKAVYGGRKSLVFLVSLVPMIIMGLALLAMG